MKVLLFIAVASFALAQDQSGAMEGTVMNSASHLPVKKAHVLITRAPTPPSSISTDRVAATDANGRFSATGLVPGMYMVLVFAADYPAARSPSGAARRTVAVASGGTPAKVDFELMPGSAISGRIVDEDGDPLSRCFVQVRTATAVQRPGRYSSAQQTDDDGEYRLFGMPAGRYTVMAQCAAPFQPRPFSSGPPPPPSIGYSPMFYPDATSPAGGAVIELAPGVEKTGIDFKMRPAPVYTVHVTPEGVAFRMMPRDAAMFAALGTRGGGPDFTGVFPGRYRLVAGRGEGNLSGEASFEVSDHSVDVEVPMHPAVEIRGTIEMEDGQKPPVGLRVHLDGIDGSVPAVVNADGSFTLPSVGAHIWRVGVFGQGVFIRSVVFAGIEVKDRAVDMTSGVPGQLRIVLSTRTGVLRGTAPMGMTVYASREDEDSMFMQAVDSIGNFVFPSLPPGKYMVFVDDGSGTALDAGKEVAIGEGETVNVELKAPAQ